MKSFPWEILKRQQRIHTRIWSTASHPCHHHASGIATNHDDDDEGRLDSGWMRAGTGGYFRPSVGGVALPRPATTLIYTSSCPATDPALINS